MARKVTLELTYEQAVALRQLCFSSDQVQSEHADFTPVMRRAVARLEDAIEAAAGAKFVIRITERARAAQ